MEPAGQQESDWVARAQLGDEAAFDALLRRFQRPVLHFVYRMLGHAQDAEDVAQETFVRAFFALPRYRPRGGVRFSSWLFQIARHAALDHLRKAGRRVEISEADAAEPVAATPGADQLLACRELGDRVAGAVAALPEDQRAAFVLAEYHGLSAAEVADVMRSSVRAAESRIFRARQALRRSLRDERPG
jgi:RNA polymerase sigma-70 factor (ECF subfamily)